uniref:Uncharacterized protein LOC105066495 isoform X2 n=1 Tax=Camelus bactrianus TaxID=9837 RepID=A0A9W3G0W4_CAMBA|nr:uncharacterized protein LOC105066495 isoform X2 [Camelus bactrianus]XP_045370284.1 uncharacterized protein LOC105066495 isoform X2 [Camelus bactrianus]
MFGPSAQNVRQHLGGQHRGVIRERVEAYAGAERGGSGAGNVAPFHQRRLHPNCWVAGACASALRPGGALQARPWSLEAGSGWAGPLQGWAGPGRLRRRLLPPVPGPEKGAKEASEERAQRMPPGRATPGPQLTWACSAPDCPGLTQGMVQLLRSHGIKTVVDFVSADLEVVAQKCGLSYKALVALRRVLLAQFSAFPFNGADLYEELKTYTAILSTGIESLDKLLDAGLYTGEVTEIVGGPGSGKTQVHVRPAAGGLVEVCLCVSAHVACGLQQNILYIDSNGGFTASCILQLLQARTPDEEEQAGALQRIQVVRAFDIFQLLDVLQDLGGTVAQQEAFQTAHPPTLQSGQLGATACAPTSPLYVPPRGTHCTL